MKTYEPSKGDVNAAFQYGAMPSGDYAALGDADYEMLRTFVAAVGAGYGMRMADHQYRASGTRQGAGPNAPMAKGSTYRPGLPSFGGNTYQNACNCGTCPVHGAGKTGGLEDEISKGYANKGGYNGKAAGNARGYRPSNASTGFRGNAYRA